MHGKPSLLFLLAGALAIGWVFYKAAFDQPPPEQTTRTVIEQSDPEDRAPEEPGHFGPERRARMEEALRAKAGRF